MRVRESGMPAVGLWDSLFDPAAILDALRLTARALPRFGVPHPRLAVAGLNPHAGEGGLMGHEEAEVIAQANATEFGLAAYFFSRDVGRIFRVAEALESDAAE